jgi:hypothetical protein
MCFPNDGHLITLAIFDVEASDKAERAALGNRVAMAYGLWLILEDAKFAM